MNVKAKIIPIYEGAVFVNLKYLKGTKRLNKSWGYNGVNSPYATIRGKMSWAKFLADQKRLSKMF